MNNWIVGTKFPNKLASEPVRSTVLRELKNMWPFWVGFGVTGALVFKMSLGITDEDIKNSKFATPDQPHKH